MRTQLATGALELRCPCRHINVTRQYLQHLVDCKALEARQLLFLDKRRADAAAARVSLATSPNDGFVMPGEGRQCQRCPSCTILCDRISGCPSVTCRCGHSFQFAY